MNSRLAQRYHQDGMSVTPGPQLVVKLYERLLLDLHKAKQAMLSNDVEVAHRELVHAQDIVFELDMALDVDAWDGGPALRSIYQHLTSRLVEANVRKDVPIVDECIDVVAPLVDAWQEALLITQTRRSDARTATAPAGGFRGAVTA